MAVQVELLKAKRILMLRRKNKAYALNLRMARMLKKYYAPAIKKFFDYNFIVVHTVDEVDTPDREWTHANDSLIDM